MPFSAIDEADVLHAGEPDRETLRRRAAHAGPIEEETIVYRIESHAVDAGNRPSTSARDLTILPGSRLAQRPRPPEQVVGHDREFVVQRGEALNQLMRSYAAHHRDDPRALLLMAPAWVQTELGGPGARLTVDESIPGLVSTIDSQRGPASLQFLDYQGETVPW